MEPSPKPYTASKEVLVKRNDFRIIKKRKPKTNQSYLPSRRRKFSLLKVPKSKVSDHGLKYEGMLQGPILLTASHSAMVLRGRGIENEPERIHWREEWVSHITIKLAYHLAKIHNRK